MIISWLFLRRMLEHNVKDIVLIIPRVIHLMLTMYLLPCYMLQIILFNIIASSTASFQDEQFTFEIF